MPLLVNVNVSVATTLVARMWRGEEVATVANAVQRKTFSSCWMLSVLKCLLNFLWQHNTIGGKLSRDKNLMERTCTCFSHKLIAGVSQSSFLFFSCLDVVVLFIYFYDVVCFVRFLRLSASVLVRSQLTTARVAAISSS